MTQNLALEGGITLTSNLSNVATPYPLPASNNTTGTNTWNNGTDQANREQMYFDSHINEAPDNISSGENQNRGAYYTFQAATAGTGSSVTTQYDNTINDICPKGWHLPAFNDADGSTGVGGEFGDLTALTGWDGWNNNINSGYFSDFGNAFTSHCNYAGCPYSGDIGIYSYWWSSTIFDADTARALYAGSSNGLYAHNTSRGRGFTIRCVAIMDSEAPSKPSLTRTAYNTFTISSSDDNGVTGYYVSVDDTTAPNGSSSWTSVTSTENLSTPYTIDTSAAHVYRVWTRDAAGNISAVSDPMVSRLVTHTQGENTTLTVYHDSVMGTGNTSSCTSDVNGVSLTTLGHTGSGSFAVLSGTPVCTSATANTDGYAPSTFTWNEIDILGSRGGYSANVTTTTAITTGAATKVTLVTATYLQDITSEACANTPTTDNVSDVYFLKDRRFTGDGTQRSYRVRKLGTHCWMVQNLALTTSTELNHTYSNIETNKTYTLPSIESDQTATWNNNPQSDPNIEQMNNGTHLDNQPDGVDDNLGGYYTWQVATAGTGSSITTTKYNSTFDICPDGWHLPSWNSRNDGSNNQNGSEISEITGLTNNWGAYVAPSSPLVTYMDAGFTGGCHSNGCPYGTGQYSFWWSSTAASERNNYRLNYALTGTGSNKLQVVADTPDRHIGYQIRCVAK